MIKNCAAIILSVEGLALNEAEAALFRAVNPYGFILFGRNCQNPQQVRMLTDDLRKIVGRDCPILIDQEGGRVQRLKPPVWRGFPAAQTFGKQALDNLDESLETIRFVTLQMAQELKECGVNVNCAPVLDVLRNETHDVIGDRAYSDDPDLVARLGLSVCRHYIAAGITPIIKHIPGHGRALSDSHKSLPVVSASREDLQGDFSPFKAIAQSNCGGQVWAMASHVIYSAIDGLCPASVSSVVINDIIRGEIGFDGVLISDDLDMDALAGYGNVAQRASATLAAGADLALYCSGKMPDMQKIAESVPKLTSQAIIRLKKAA